MLHRRRARRDVSRAAAPRAPRTRGGRLTIENHTGYDDAGLRRFFLAGLGALGWPRGDVHITVVASPIRSRGCAQVGGSRMVIAIAAPSRFTMRRFARLFEHELQHLKGTDHGGMGQRTLYSLGEVPRWARRLEAPRHRHRAPPQHERLARRGLSHA